MYASRRKHRIVTRAALTWARSLPLLLLLLQIPAPAEASCPSSSWRYTLLTPSSAALPSDASLLVGLQVAYHEDSALDTATDPAALFAEARLERGAETISLSLEWIAAPSLLRLRPQRSPSPGSWALRGLPDGVEAELSFGSEVLPPAPQRPRRTSLRQRHGRSMGRRSSYYQGRLRPTPPAGSRLLVRWVEAGGQETIGMWGEGEARGLVIMSYSQRCVGGMPGWTRPTSTRTRARFLLIDTYGQVSEATQPRRVAYP